MGIQIQQRYSYWMIVICDEDKIYVRKVCVSLDSLPRPGRDANCSAELGSRSAGVCELFTAAFCLLLPHPVLAKHFHRAALCLIIGVWTLWKPRLLLFLRVCWVFTTLGRTTTAGTRLAKILSTERKRWQQVQSSGLSSSCFLTSAVLHSLTRSGAEFSETGVQISAQNTHLSQASVSILSSKI